MPTNPPWAMVLGITGHRQISDPASISSSIRSVLAELALPLTSLAQPKVSLTLLSPLAEGADRLAAHEILRLPQGVLQAVLPLSPDEYEKDFDSTASRAEFRALLARAASVEIFPLTGDRTEVYHAVGCHVVDACDILLAVWDLLPARGAGGTADVVSYARKRHKPLIIIYSLDPTRIITERLDDQS